MTDVEKDFHGILSGQGIGIEWLPGSNRIAEQFVGDPLRSTGWNGVCAFVWLDWDCARHAKVRFRLGERATTMDETVVANRELGICALDWGDMRASDPEIVVTR